MFTIAVPASVDKTDVVPNVKVVVRKAVTLKCPASGNPHPKIIWYKDGEELNITGNKNMKLKNKGQLLEIISITTNDGGSYECRAINEAGEDRLYYHINVHGKLLSTYIEYQDEKTYKQISS